MKERFRQFFSGRQGMDELSKVLFWSSIIAFFLSVLTAGILGGVLSTLLTTLAVFALITAFIRAFSRDLSRRETENAAYLKWLDGKRRSAEAAKNRRAQKDYRFFKCPGCGQYLRVPKGKGKIHISCRCGYTLYRKT